MISRVSRTNRVIQSGPSDGSPASQRQDLRRVMQGGRAYSSVYAVDDENGWHRC